MRAGSGDMQNRREVTASAWKRRPGFGWGRAQGLGGRANPTTPPCLFHARPVTGDVRGARMALANGPQHSQWKREAGAAEAPGIYRAPGDVRWSPGHHWQLARERSGRDPAGSRQLSRDSAQAAFGEDLGEPAVLQHPMKVHTCRDLPAAFRGVQCRRRWVCLRETVPLWSLCAGAGSWQKCDPEGNPHWISSFLKE
ncbi:unnamed protein product [Coccothraustes coccothraustes]